LTDQRFDEFNLAAFPDVTFDRHLKEVIASAADHPRRKPDGQWRPLLLGYSGGGNIGAEIRLSETIRQLALFSPLKPRAVSLGTPLALRHLRAAEPVMLDQYLPDFLEWD